MNTPASKLKLYGFNNLTKNLSFSLYKLHYINNSEAQEQYQQFINQTYSADKLNQLLTKVCHAIGGNVLNVAQQNYQPQGASVTLMISEELQPQSLVAHLDKSHLCVHTYPDNQITNNVAIFRADIELSTCGVISPLKVINYLMETLQPDIAEIDFRVRGMTRDIKGNKLFIDDKVTSISEHLNAHIKDIFEIEYHNFPRKNLFYAKFRRNHLDLKKTFFTCTKADNSTDTNVQFSPTEKIKINQALQKELNELASFMNKE